MLFSELMDTGKRFHKVGAATIKVRSPIVFFVLIRGVHRRIFLSAANCSEKLVEQIFDLYDT